MERRQAQRLAGNEGGPSGKRKARETGCEHRPVGGLEMDRACDSLGSLSRRWDWAQAFRDWQLPSIPLLTLLKGKPAAIL